MERRRRTIATLAVAAVLALTACGGDDDSTGEQPSTTGAGTTTDPGRAIETDDDDLADLEELRAGLTPRDYYDRYDETTPACNSYGAPGRAPTVEADDGAADVLVEVEEAHAPPPVVAVPEIHDPLVDNTFDDVGDTGFVPTEIEARSTFALDIDTGSWRVAQRFAEDGYQPPADSIRTEEWINAFDYGYEPPTDADLGLTVSSGVVPHTPDGTRLVQVGVDSRRIADEERPPANVTFVIDTSGSMDYENRLGLVKSSLALLVMNLNPDDQIGIVEFGSEAQTVLEHQPVAHGERIIAALDRLAPCGATNMDAGMHLGYEQARSAYDPERLNVVVAAGDGVANVGIDDPDEMMESIVEQGNDGINLVSVGFGMGNYNDPMLEQIANLGDGFYSYVDTYEEAERLFVDELTPTMTMIAGDARVQVTFDDDVVESYRLIGYENREMDNDDFRDDEVDAGELGAGHTATALYEVRLRDLDADAAEVGEVALRWLSLDDDEWVERAEPIEVGPRGGDNDDAMALAATAAYSAEVLRGNSAVTGRQLSVDVLLDDARALADSGVAGAEELAEYLEIVIDLPSADD